MVMSISLSPNGTSSLCNECMKGEVMSSRTYLLNKECLRMFCYIDINLLALRVCDDLLDCFTAP